MLLRLAIRNLFRHRWRTYLTIGGIAISTALLIWLLALLTGIYAEMARGTTSVELGQIQIQSEEYVERPSIHHHFPVPTEFIQLLADTEGVDALAPRVIINGLVGHEEHSRISRIKGVDPDREAQVTIVEQALIAGTWLSDEAPDEMGPRQVVLGSVMARSLDTEVGDELVVLAQAADGALGNELLEVAGIVHTGNIAIDRQTAFMRLDDVQFMAALEGEVHEIALATSLDGAPVIAAELERRFHQLQDMPPLVVRPWQEIATEIYLMVELAEQVSWWLLFIIFAIAALGIFNTLRMSTLERQREFGVLMGVGLSRSRLMIMIVIEGVILGIFGALIGGLLGIGLAHYTGTTGLNIALLTGAESLSLMGVAFGDRVHFDISLRALTMPLIGIVIITSLCAMWPAAMAVRQEPRDAIAGR